MLTSFKDIINRTKDLEERLNKIEKSYSFYDNENYISNFTNNCINVSVLNKKTIPITEFKNNGSQLFYQLSSNFSITTDQEIEFYLIVDNIKIGKTKQHFFAGNNIVSISGIYQDVVNSNIKVKLSINPIDDKLIVINSATLTVWGNNLITPSEEYCAVETNTEFILSHISNNRLYICNILKDYDLNNEMKFNFLISAKSHSICHNPSTNISYLFRVDTNNNLFFSNLSTLDELFISNNVEKISAISSDEKIIFAFIKNTKCYYGEIINNSIISINKITQLHGSITDCYLYLNNLNNKVYLILHKDDNSNYILEGIKQNHKNSDSINTEISLLISTYAGEI